MYRFVWRDGTSLSMKHIIFLFLLGVALAGSCFKEIDGVNHYELPSETITRTAFDPGVWFSGPGNFSVNLCGTIECDSFPNCSICLANGDFPNGMCIAEYNTAIYTSIPTEPQNIFLTTYTSSFNLDPACPSGRTTRLNIGCGVSSRSLPFYDYAPPCAPIINVDLPSCEWTQRTLEVPGVDVIVVSPFSTTLDLYYPYDKILAQPARYKLFFNDETVYYGAGGKIEIKNLTSETKYGVGAVVYEGDEPADPEVARSKSNFKNITIHTLNEISPSKTCVKSSAVSMATFSCATEISDVTFASYGTPTGSCGVEAESATCHAQNSSAALRALVVGKKRVSFSAPSLFNSDPCPGYAKNFIGRVTCAPVTCVTVPERTIAALRCPDNEVITGVEFASFGAPSGSCESTLQQNSTCHSPLSIHVVKELCVGRQECFIGSFLRVFGEPCINVVKKLSVKVSCGPSATIPTTQYTTTGQTIEEDGEFTNACTFPKIAAKILFASWGTPTGNDPGPYQMGACHQDVRDYVGIQCLTASTCYVSANNDGFNNDPCQNVAKRLKIQLQCMDPPAQINN